MDPTLRTRLDELRDTNWHDLLGARAELHVPIREGLLNDLIQQLVLPRVPALSRLSVAIGPDNRLDVTAKSSRFGFLPAMTIPLEIERNIGPGTDRVLRLHVRNDGAGALVGSLMSLWPGTLPPGVRLSPRLIEIDLAQAAAPHDDWRLLQMFQSAAIETAPRELRVTVTLAR